MILTGANTYTGDTVLGLGAALQAAQGTGLPSTSYLKLNGGIYETIGTFTRANSTTQSGSNFTWSGGGGGFGAFGGKLTVTIGGSASITQTWGTVAANDTIVGPLVLGAQDSDAEVDFQNNINLNKGIRTISVPLAATGAFATISGVISGTGTNSSLSKSLLGTLVLSNTNTYSGATTVTSGKLTISSTGSINSTSGVSIGAAEFNYNSATALS